ncbi:MAG: AMP-binding protein, partial [Elusimicrobia bacterium]|nr:AMP-binding protein [Elusimicrobiota bacterium]
DRVAALAHNEAELVVLLLACRAGGFTLCPLNWRLAGPELSAVLGDFRPALLFHGAAFAEASARLAAACGARRLSFCDFADARAEQGAAPRAGLPKDEAVPLVLYTSGTTGRPKGAMLSNRMLHANASLTLLGWGLGPDDATVSGAPLFHTGGWNVMTLPLLFGGGQVTLTAKFEAPRTAELLRAGRATALFGVPAMFQSLLAEDLGSWKPYFLVSGGAPCPAPLLDDFLGRGLVFKQGFGMTEVGPNCFCFPTPDVRRKRGSVGVPMPGTEMRLLDPDGREADAGELYVRGPHVFSGYLGRPEETAQTLVDGWVRTGDLAQRDADGYFYVLGRRKEMYISGGENVYPVEVEAALQAHPGVLEAAVVGVPHERWGEVGRAFVVARPGAAVSSDELAAFLDGRLARYKRPKEIRIRASLPKNAMGKVLKGALS